MILLSLRPRVASRTGVTTSTSPFVEISTSLLSSSPSSSSRGLSRTSATLLPVRVSFLIIVCTVYDVRTYNTHDRRPQKTPLYPPRRRMARGEEPGLGPSRAHRCGSCLDAGQPARGAGSAGHLEIPH